MPAASVIPAPLLLLRTVVRPEWLDYNRHMTEGYYGVVFGDASDAFIDYMGMDADYRQDTGGAIYTVESHINFLRELKEGEPLQLTTQLLGYDVKRMHVYHEMFADDAPEPSATFESMMLHFNQREQRVTPMPAAIQDRFARVYEAHLALPWPEKAGQAIRRLARP